MTGGGGGAGGGGGGDGSNGGGSDGDSVLHAVRSGKKMFFFPPEGDVAHDLKQPATTRGHAHPDPRTFARTSPSRDAVMTPNPQNAPLMRQRTSAR